MSDGTTAETSCPSSSNAIHNQVASAVWASLVRIAGGGFLCRASTATIPPDFHEGLNSSPKVVCDLLLWKEELKKISRSTVSFPNRLKSSVDGKPHDVEVRAALSLFHRIVRRTNTCVQRMIYDGKSSLCNKRKRQSKCDAAIEKTTKRPSNGEHRVPSQELGSLRDRVVLFELISDFGTRREIDSIKSLANLLSLELEKELSARNSLVQNRHDGSGNGHVELPKATSNDGSFKMAEDQNLVPFMIFCDIRSDDSGTICLVSSHRSKQLHAAGRIPCPHCVKWLKGNRGLWWHQLSAHGIDYSSATESAS